MKEKEIEENIIKDAKENKTFNKLQELQILIRKESSLKGLCKNL